MALGIGVLHGAYPEQRELRLSRLDRIGENLAASIRRRRRSLRLRRRPFARMVDCASDRLDALSNDELRSEALRVGERLAAAGFADELVARAFAIVREVASREIGLRPFDSQLEGGRAMLAGMIAEMETGEGKTLTAALTACTAALAGIPVHVVTVNDYLAERDAGILEPVYTAIGLRVSTALPAMTPEARRTAYRADVTYTTSKQVVFDYLWDRITLEGRSGRIRYKLDNLRTGGAREQLIHRGLRFAIVDEVDSVLIDEARTPLIISEKNEDGLEQKLYRTAIDLAQPLVRDEHFRIDERHATAELLAPGIAALDEPGNAIGGVFGAPMRRETLVRQALTALHCYHRDRHYLIRDDRLEIIDEYTGRVMRDRSWEHGLHQLIEAKEGIPLTGRNAPRARISHQRFFPRYLHLCGMTGTAAEVRRELAKVYDVGVATIRPNRPVARRFLGERIFDTSERKWRHVVQTVRTVHETGRPVLVGTRSVAASEHLSELLEAEGLPHRVLNARQDAGEAAVVADAGKLGSITVATNMAGRGTDIRIDDAVRERGGLHVIATERHEARRIDRQLFGRCGRQGDPGTTESIVSLEDELFTMHADWLARRLAYVALNRSTGTDLPLRIALDRCQRVAERLHARIRRELLDRDKRIDTMLAFSGRGRG